MFTLTLIVAMFLLIVCIIKPKMMFFMACAIAWIGLIWVLAHLSQTEDIQDSLAIQIVAGIISAWCIVQFFRIRKGSDIG